MGGYAKSPGLLPACVINGDGFRFPRFQETRAWRIAGQDLHAVAETRGQAARREEGIRRRTVDDGKALPGRSASRRGRVAAPASRSCPCWYIGRRLSRGGGNRYCSARQCRGHQLWLTAAGDAEGAGCIDDEESQPGAGVQFQPGPVHGPRLLRQAAGQRHRQHPRDPGRDRRRVRRQDARLSRAAGAGAVEEDRPPGQDA